MKFDSLEGMAHSPAMAVPKPRPRNRCSPFSTGRASIPRRSGSCARRDVFFPNIGPCAAKVETVLDLAYAPKLAAEVTLQPDQAVRLRRGDLVFGYPRRSRCAEPEGELRRGRGAEARGARRPRGARAPRGWQSILDGSRRFSRRSTRVKRDLPRGLRDAGLLRRALDGRELHDRRPRHARSRPGPALRLPISCGFRRAHRPLGRGVDRLSFGTVRGGRGGGADFRELRRGHSPGLSWRLVARADPAHRGRLARESAAGADHRLREG